MDVVEGKTSGHYRYSVRCWCRDHRPPSRPKGRGVACLFERPSSPTLGYVHAAQRKDPYKAEVIQAAVRSDPSYVKSQRPSESYRDRGSWYPKGRGGKSHASLDSPQSDRRGMSQAHGGSEVDENHQVAEPKNSLSPPHSGSGSRHPVVERLRC